MPPDKQNVTITLKVDTKALLGYYLDPDPKKPPFNIDNYCSFEQSGGGVDKGNGTNEDFKTKVKISEVKSITWVGVSSSIPAFGNVNILAIINETYIDVFSSLNCSGNPRNIVGTLENKTITPTGDDNESYSIYFHVDQPIAPGLPLTLYKIDPKLEINT